MSYEIHLDTFHLLSDADYLPALQRALRVLSETRNRTLILPNREVDARGSACLEGANRARIIGDGGTVLRGTNLYQEGCYDCKIDTVELLATASNPKPALSLETLADRPAPAGQNTFTDVRIEGLYATPVYIGDAAGLGNNDFHTFTRLTTYGSSFASVHIDSNMSVGNQFQNCHLYGGEYGVVSRGAFAWRGGRSGSHSVSDFWQQTANSVPGTISIDDLNSEDSARLYINYAPTGPGEPPATTSQIAGMPVSFTNVRFAVDSVVKDATDNFEGWDFTFDPSRAGEPGRVGVAVPINGGITGPYTVTNCHFAHGITANARGVVRIKLRVGGGAGVLGHGGRVSECMFPTDNIEAPLVDRGTARNNQAYLHLTDSYAWFPDHVA